MEAKYKMVEGSITGHCCFGYSILRILEEDEEDYGSSEDYDQEYICECFEKENAEKILKALENEAKRAEELELITKATELIESMVDLVPECHSGDMYSMATEMRVTFIKE